jgi:RPA family protein
VNPVQSTPPASNAAEGMDGEGRPQREVAQRVFAAEFNDASFSFKESGDRSPTFVVSKMGAKINRLFAVGILTSVEAVGQSGDRWRAQVVDPTGTFNVYTGQYEPEATAQLMDIRPPAVVAVVGKSRTYQPETGVTYVSVRPESIRVVEKADRDAWTLDVVKHGLMRLDAMREAQKLEPPTPKALEDLGYPKDLAEGVCKAIEHYGKPDLARYATMLRDALESLLPGAAERMSAEPDFAPAAAAYTPPATRTAPAPVPATAAKGPAPVATTHAAPAPATKAAPPAAAKKPDENPHEELILSLAEKLDDGKGAPWEDIVAEAAKKGVREEAVEECLNGLMDKGQIYEPVLGRLKRT